MSFWPLRKVPKTPQAWHGTMRALLTFATRVANLISRAPATLTSVWPVFRYWVDWLVERFAGPIH
jgi:hypothetical protein